VIVLFYTLLTRFTFSCGISEEIEYESIHSDENGYIFEVAKVFRVSL